MSYGRNDGFASAFEDGFIKGFLITLLLQLIWKLRWIILAVIGGWWFQYYWSGDADINRMVEKHFDKNKAQLSSTMFASEVRHSGQRGYTTAYSAGSVAVTNATPAPLIGFRVDCTYYRKPEYKGDKPSMTRRSVSFWPDETVYIEPGKTKTISVYTDAFGMSFDVDADQSTMNCTLFNRTFDEHAMIAAAKRARKN